MSDSNLVWRAHGGDYRVVEIPATTRFRLAESQDRIEPAPAPGPKLAIEPILTLKRPGTGPANLRPTMEKVVLQS